MELTTLSIGQQKLKLQEQIIIIINGKGGVGKDTVCDIASRYLYTHNISAITPIKEIAMKYGWNGEKDARSRKFLSDLKRTFADYCDLPTNYLESEYHKFINSKNDILFVHIRENDQIDALKARINHKCVTLLIRSNRAGHGCIKYGNEADDNVENYSYDYIYSNDKTIEALAPDFMHFLFNLLVNENALYHEKMSESC